MKDQKGLSEKKKKCVPGRASGSQNGGNASGRLVVVRRRGEGHFQINIT